MKWVSVLASLGLMTMLTVTTSGCKKGGAGGGATWGSLDQPSKVTIKQGEKADLKVSITRKDNSKDEITVKVTPPKGVEVEPAEKKLKDTEKEAVFSLKAAADATSGDATVTATPGDLKHTVRIEVEKEKAGEKPGKKAD